MAVTNDKVGEELSSFRVLEKQQQKRNEELQVEEEEEVVHNDDNNQEGSVNGNTVNENNGGKFKQAVHRVRDYRGSHHNHLYSTHHYNNNHINNGDNKHHTTTHHSYYHKNCFTTNNNIYYPYSKKLYNKNYTNNNNNFIDSLDEKLRNLKDGSKLGCNNPHEKRTSSKRNLENRPMFVTTVKTGIFLDPPPELAAILGLQNSNTNSSGSTASGNDQHMILYSFSSRPRILNTRHQQNRSNKSNKNNNNVSSKSNKNNVNNDQQIHQSTINQQNTSRRSKRDLKDINRTIHEDSSSNSSPPSKKPGRKGVTNEPGPGGWRHEECRGESQKELLSYGNIMYDRRVVRGSTVAQHPFSVPGPESNAARIAEARRRTMARKKAQGQATRAMRLRLGTPPPVEGRKHEDVQTEVFLEELFDHPKEETVAVQTEPFLDRPETPPYIPAKTGVDVSTQIEPGELFDFNVEVQPILEVLVGKTIEQALIEVLEEDELAAIKEQQRRYREIRAAEKAEEERLEEEERRRREEKDRRVAEQMDACRIQKETEERVAAAVLTTGYIADLLPSVLDGLKLAGYLVDDIKEDLEENYMPWLMEEIKLEMQRMVENRDLLSEIVREILETRAALYVNEGKSEDYDKNPLPDPYTLRHEGEEEGEPEEEQNPVRC